MTPKVLCSASGAGMAGQFAIFKSWGTSHKVGQPRTEPDPAFFCYPGVFLAYLEPSLTLTLTPGSVPRRPALGNMLLRSDLKGFYTYILEEIDSNGVGETGGHRATEWKRGDHMAA